MFEILKYDFFINALFAGIILSIIAGFLSNLIILKREANLVHAISNFSFLGIVLGLYFQMNLDLFGIIFAIFGAILIFLIEKNKLLYSESTKEIISIFGMGISIFLLSFFSIKNDINSFLFGNILNSDKEDILFLSIFGIFVLILSFFFLRNFLLIIFSKEIAISNGLKIGIYELGFGILMAIFIGFSIKIFGVLLLSAFLILPGNIGKIASNNLFGMFIYSLISSIFAVILGLFGSVIFSNSGANANIILILILFFTIFYIKRIIKN